MTPFERAKQALLKSLRTEHRTLNYFKRKSEGVAKWKAVREARVQADVAAIRENLAVEGRRPGHGFTSPRRYRDAARWLVRNGNLPAETVTRLFS